MKTLSVFVLFCAAACAETISGTLVDTMCHGKGNVAEHTRQCAMGCAKSGYGIVTADGKFVKLDAAGNTKALAALKASKKEKDLKAKVTGEMEGDSIKVETLELE